MKRIQGSPDKFMVWLGIVWCVILLLSCSLKPENEILGKWKEEGGTEIMEFFKDGTVSVEDEGMSMKGNYKVVDESNIRLELVGDGTRGGPILAKGSFSSGKLNFTRPNGEVFNYSKFK